MEEEKWINFNLKLYAEALREGFCPNITFEITKKCNLRCIHCYQVEKTLPELKYNEICKILKQFKKFGALYLIFTGGEPFLRKDFLPIYLYAYRLGFIITIMNNATLIDENIVRVLKRHPPYSVEVSIYGYRKETHEKITKVKGSYRKTFNGVNILLKGGIKVLIKTVVMKFNKDEIFELRKLVENMGARYMYDVGLLPKLNFDKKNLKYRIFPEEAVKLELEDKDRVRKIRKMWDSFSSKGIDRKKIFNCGAGYLDLYMDSYGILRICSFLVNEGINLKRYNIKEAFKLYIKPRRETDRKENSICEECDYYPICLNCPARALLEEGNEEGISKYFCKLTKLRANAIFKKRREKNEVRKEKV